MDGYGAASYGDAFADVYDDWYDDLGAVDVAVRRLSQWAEGEAVLELGVGTGRLAIALAATGVTVWGVDASAVMLERLRAKPGGTQVRTVVADMADLDLGDTGAPAFGLVLVAFNTFFNLSSPDAQQRCLERVHALLGPGGRLVLEAAVPDLEAASSAVEVRAVELDRVVLIASRRDADGTVRGQHVELRENGIRLRPWVIRPVSPQTLDAMAERVGLHLEQRLAGWDGDAFRADSPAHVSVYLRR